MQPQSGVLPKYVFLVGAAPSKNFSWPLKKCQKSLFLKKFSENVLKSLRIKTRVLQNFFSVRFRRFPAIQNFQWCNIFVDPPARLPPAKKDM